MIYFLYKDIFLIFLCNQIFLQYLQSLLGDKGLLNKYLIPENEEWTDLNLQAICCLEGILMNKNTNTYISQEYICTIKDVVLNTVSLLPCSNHSAQCYSKVINYFNKCYR